MKKISDQTPDTGHFVSIRCYSDLNDYLPVKYRYRSFKLHLQSQYTVESLLRSFAIPMTRIDLILINNEPAGFDYIIQPDDRISVYPEFRDIDISPLGLIHRGYLI